MDSFRTSIQWSRLLDINGKINQSGANFYHKVINCAKENNIEIFMNLYHFDMPTYLFNKGGWENREVVEAYAHYAKMAFKEFGQEIKYWFTFNEPIFVLIISPRFIPFFFNSFINISIHSTYICHYWHPNFIL